MHPYHVLLNLWQRHAHSKVDFYMPGFEMPDYVQDELKKRTFYEARGKLDLLYKMIINNYFAEDTQVTYWGNGSWMPFELLLCNNLLS